MKLSFNYTTGERQRIGGELIDFADQCLIVQLV